MDWINWDYVPELDDPGIEQFGGTIDDLKAARECYKFLFNAKTLQELESFGDVFADQINLVKNSVNKFTIQGIRGVWKSKMARLAETS